MLYRNIGSKTDGQAARTPVPALASAGLLAACPCVLAWHPDGGCPSLQRRLLSSTAALAPTSCYCVVACIACPSACHPLRRPAARRHSLPAARLPSGIVNRAPKRLNAATPQKRTAASSPPSSACSAASPASETSPQNPTCSRELETRRVNLASSQPGSLSTTHGRRSPPV